MQRSFEVMLSPISFSFFFGSVSSVVYFETLSFFYLLLETSSTVWHLVSFFFFFFRYIWDTFTCSGLKTFEISVVVQLFIIAICSPMEERGIYFVCLILLVWIFYSLIRPPFDWFLVLKLNHTTLHCTASIPWLFHNLMIIFEEFSLIACDAS